MIVTALLVAVTMAGKDLLYTATTVFVAKGRPLPAALFDMCGDIASVLTFGVGGVAVVKHGVSVYTLVVFAAMAVGSLLGTYGGMAVARAVEKRLGVPIPHPLNP